MSEAPASPVRVIPGAGAVMRYGTTTMVALGATPPVLRHLRESVQEASYRPDATEAVVRAVEVARGDGVRAAALVVEDDAATLVVSGDVDVCALLPAGELRLNGDRIDAVVRHAVDRAFTTVVLGATAHADADADAWWELSEGSVPGAGVSIDLRASLTAGTSRPAHDAEPEGHPTLPFPRLGVGEVPEPAGATPEPPAPTHDLPSAELESAAEPPMFRPTDPPSTPAVALPPPPEDVGPQVEPDVPFESVVLGGAGASAGAEAEHRAPLDDRIEAEESAAPTVEGLKCSRGHFNHPLSANCAWCGIGMAQASHVLVSGERPPLGVLVVNGQATLTLDTGYVIGRQPALDDAVDGIMMRELALGDDQRSISRIHAHIRLEGWDVVVEDRGSGIGTWVLPMDGPRVPARVEPGRPRPLRSGDQVLIGPHQLTFHSHHLR